MADTTTTNYSLTKPEVGASADTWGGKININLDTLDTTIKSVSNVANAAIVDGSNTVDATNIAADAVGASELNVLGNGTAGQYLGSDGDGTMTWTTLSSDPTMGGDLSGTASNAQIVANAVGTTEIANSAVTDAKISGMSSSKLIGALPAIDGSALTGMASGLPSTVGRAQDDALVVNSNGTTSWQTLYATAIRYHGPNVVSGSWLSTVTVSNNQAQALIGTLTSNSIGDNGSTTATVIFNAGVEITYRWRTSSEACCDKTRVYENGTQVYVGSTASWTTRTYTSSGNNQLQFTYYKDSSASAGADNCLVEFLSSSSFTQQQAISR